MLLIRKAIQEDAGDMAALQKASITHLCAKHYDPYLLRRWLECIRPEEYLLAFRRMDCVVALGREALLGFGSLDRQDARICGLYVAPGQAGNGLGSQLLQTLERLALYAGLEKLFAFSTLNAENFFWNQGYELVRKATHTLFNATCLPCVKMEKELFD